MSKTMPFARVLVTSLSMISASGGCALALDHTKGSATSPVSTSSAQLAAKNNAPPSSSNVAGAQTTSGSAQRGSTSSDSSKSDSSAAAAPLPTTLPAAAMHDAKLESAMHDAIQAEWRSDTIMNVIITDADWTVHNSALTGLPVNRTIGTSVVTKQTKGCRLFHVTFIQLASGKAFGTTAYNSVGDSSPISCDAVHK